MTEFYATYCVNFEHVEFVKKTIADWKDGVQSFVLKSSGSTGNPKEISLSRDLLLWSAQCTYSSLELTKENILCCIPITKTGGFMQLIRALVWNCPIHFVNPITNPFEGLKCDDFSITSLTPHQIYKCVDQSSNKLSQFQNILIGGASLNNELAKNLISLAPNTQFWETYGMTETASHIALRKIPTDNFFKPQPGVKISTQDGILHIAIPEIHFKVKTNDLVQIHDKGFKVLGRVDYMINSGGIKLNPLELEPIVASLLADNKISNTFYLSKKEDAILGEKMVLIIEEEPSINTLNLLDILKTNLPKHSAPKEIILVSKITYTDTGKVKRLRIK